MTGDAAKAQRGAGRRQRLEARANAVREQLLDGLDALRGKKGLLLDPAEYARRHTAGAVLVAGAAALVLATTAGVVGYRMSTRKERLVRRRLDAWKKRVTRLGLGQSSRPSVTMVALERSLVAGLSSVVAALGKHLVEELLTRFRVGDAPADVRP